MNIESRSSDVTASERVIQEVASARGVAPTKLEPPLNDTIDPDALDKLFLPSRSNAERASPRVTFTYLDYRIVVTSDSVRVSSNSQAGRATETT